MPPPPTRHSGKLTNDVELGATLHVLPCLPSDGDDLDGHAEVGELSKSLLGLWGRELQWIREDGTIQPQ